MANAVTQNGDEAKKGADVDETADFQQNRFLREKMESTLRKAREKVAEVQQDVDVDRFDKAWERVYGNKQYRPSWIGKLQNRGAPPKVRHAKAKKEPVVEEKKDEILVEETKGIPEEFRRKTVLEPLKIKGEVVPNEEALEKWRKEIETGDSTNNKVVKETNVTSWIDTNQFWKHDAEFLSGKPIKKKTDSQKPPENQKINTEKYDLVGKYEHKVVKADLKIGNKVVPKERDLKKWGEELEIPEDLTAQDFSLSPTGSQPTASSRHQSEGQKKWSNVLQTADVPNFLAYNGYW